MLGRNLECDATPSWSGYNYQGKVALYVTLDKICELLSSSRIAEISEFSLELEWIEDFSIISGTNGSNVYKTIHQVKALDTIEINDYGEAIFGLAAKVIEYNSIEKAYLHTWKPINVTDTEWKSKIKDLAQRHRKKSDLITRMEQMLVDDTELSSTVKRIINPKPGTAPDFIKRIQANIIGETTIDTVKAAIEKALVFAKLNNEGFVAKLTDANLNKIHIFNYGSSNNCDLDDIKTKILDKINRHLELQCADWRQSDRNYKEIIYHYLMGEIDKNVVARHKTFAHKSKVAISFNVFDGILRNQGLSDHSKEYYLFHLKNKIFNLHNNYCKCCSKKNEDNQVCQGCNVVMAIDDISNMDLGTFEKFCRILCPDVKGQIDDIEVFQRMLESDGINSSFFKALRDINKKHDAINEMIRYISLDNKTLLLTALANKGTDFNSSFVCASIIQNKEIDGVFMDVDELVSKDFNEDSIWECANIISRVDDVLENEFDPFDHICHCKRVSIRPVADVTRRLSI